ncbi:MAG: hypothetical protein ACOYNO_07365 [Saprospiraceae bacterium]
MNKKILFLSVLMGALVMFAPSCSDSESDACKDVDCGTNGDCFSGNCVCDDGYELGTDKKCSVLSREKFLGSYNATEACNVSGTYSCNINTSSTINKVVINNFADGGTNVTCTVDGNSITVDAGQTIQNLAVSGTGTAAVSGSKTVITWTYKVGTINCTATMTEQ